MKKKPTVTSYIDGEERELIEAIECGGYEFSESGLTVKKQAMCKKAAQHKINEQDYREAEEAHQNFLASGKKAIPLDEVFEN